MSKVRVGGFRKPKCPKNHDKTVVGIALNGQCKQCYDEYQPAYMAMYYRRRKSGSA